MTNWIRRSAVVVILVAGTLLLDSGSGSAAERNKSYTSTNRPSIQFALRLHRFAKKSAGVGTPSYYAIVRRGLDSYDEQVRRYGRIEGPAKVKFPSLAITPDAVDLDPSTQLLTSVRLGIRPDTSERIVGGWEAREGQFEQTVMIQGNSFLCSGVALDRSTVLTAAHCACDLHLSPSQQESEAREENKLVWVGLSNTSQVRRFRIDVRKTKFISNEIPCPNVMPSVLAGSPDLALIGLQDRFESDPRVKIATSAIFGASLSQNPFYVVGFGCTVPLQPNGRFLPCDSSSSGRKFVALINTSGPCTITGADGCSPGNREFVLRDFDGKVDTCAGDSGGPAIVFDGTGFYVAGITSRAWDVNGR